MKTSLRRWLILVVALIFCSLFVSALPTQAAEISFVRFKWDPNYSGGSILAERCINAKYHWLTAEEISPNPRRLGSWKYNRINGCTSHYPVTNVRVGDVVEIGIGASDKDPGSNLFGAVGTKFYRVTRTSSGITHEFVREIKPPSTPTPVTPTPVTPTPITPTPTAKHTDTQLRGAVENGKTTIFLKVCGKGKHYRFQSFSVDQNQILWDKVYGAIDGCSKEYRAAINAETGEVLRFTSTVMNGTISDSEFNQRRRDTCRIDSPGVIRCRQSDTPPPTTPTPNPGTDKTLDVRYVDQVYVQQYPENGYWNHCGPASAAMVLHYEKKELRDVLYNRQATLSLVCETKPTCYGASSPAKILNLFKQHGLNATIDWSTSFNEIKNSIDRGHPVLISIGGANHIAAAVGYRDDGTILINDPFGGKHWWSNPKNVNLRNDYINGTWTTYPSKPQLKGVEVPYIFGSEITAFYTIPISGPASKPQRLATEIDRTTGGILNAGQAILRFTGHSDVSNAQEISDTITVGYTSQFAPSYPVNQHDTAIASFVVDATNAENLSIASYGQLFEMTITLDEKIIDNWYISNGKTIGSDQASTNPIEPVTVLAQDDPGKIDASRLIITAWSPDTQQWIPLETSVDLDKYLVTASHDQFTEFAVMVEREYTVTLPLIIH